MADLPLTAGELAAMRSTSQAFMTGTAIISVATRASDGQGGQTWTYAASGTVDARLAYVKGGSEAELGGRVAEVSGLVLTVPAHTSIDEDDRVAYNSVTYEVEEVLTRVPEEIARRVRVREID